MFGFALSTINFLFQL